MYRRDEKSSGFEVLVLVPATNLKASFSHFVYSFLVMNWQVRAKERVTRARAKVSGIDCDEITLNVSFCLISDARAVAGFKEESIHSGLLHHSL